MSINRPERGTRSRNDVDEEDWRREETIDTSSKKWNNTSAYKLSSKKAKQAKKQVNREDSLH